MINSLLIKEWEFSLILCDTTHSAKVIIISRILPIFGNRESLLDSIDEVEKQDISGLTTDFAVDYLSSNGLDRIK